MKLWMEKGEGEAEGKLNSMIMIVLKFYEYFKDLNWKRIKCIISLDIDNQIIPLYQAYTAVKIQKAYINYEKKTPIRTSTAISK